MTHLIRGVEEEKAKFSCVKEKKLLIMPFFEGAVPKWLREQSAKLRFSGSNPLGASIQQFEGSLKCVVNQNEFS